MISARGVRSDHREKITSCFQPVHLIGCEGDTETGFHTYDHTAKIDRIPTGDFGKDCRRFKNKVLIKKFIFKNILQNHKVINHTESPSDHSFSNKLMPFIRVSSYNSIKKTMKSIFRGIN